MTDAPFRELRAAFDGLRAQSIEIHQLAREIAVPLELPRPRGRLAAPVPAARPPTKPLTAAEVEEGWALAGIGWVQRLNRRKLRAAMKLLGEAAGGQRLIDHAPGLAEGLVAAATPILRPGQLVEALSGIWFLDHQPRAWLTHALGEALAQLDGAPVPRWCGRPFDTADVLARVGRHCLTTSLALRDELDVPDAMLTGGWVSAILAREAPRSLDELSRLLILADRGRALNDTAVVTEPVRVAVRSGVRLGTRQITERRRIATMLRRRVGSLFGELSRTKWAGLDRELQTIRGWLVGDFLEVVFAHVTPAAMFAHQLAARQTFWTGYGASVRDLRVYVKGGRAALMRHPDVRRIVEEADELVHVGDLESPTVGQAILVMVLEAANGIVTVAEANSNGRVRIVPGPVALPRAKVSYDRHIKGGAFMRVDAFDQVHNSAWQASVRHHLERFGVRAARA